MPQHCGAKPLWQQAFSQAAAGQRSTHAGLQPLTDGSELDCRHSGEAWGTCSLRRA